MRKISALTCFILFCSLAHAQYVTIPDSDFRNFLLSKYPGCFNIALELNTSCTAITTEDSLEFHGLGSSIGYPAMNIEGIQYFNSLVYLNCSNTKISFSPALPASLKQLNFSSTSTGPGDGFLPGLPSGLQRLTCTDNYLYSLPGLPVALKYLNCSNNILSSLESLPSSLDTLICKNQLGYGPSTHVLNSIASLPAGLKYLDCSNNGLGSLPTLPATLTHLYCSEQYVNTSPEAYRRTLSTLPVLPQGLLFLDCSGNCLTAIPALPAQLQYLHCGGQYKLFYINSYDAIPDKTLSILPTLPANLLYLNCSDNFLSALPVLPATLKYLDCSSQFIYVNTFPPPPDPYNYTMASLPALPGSLTALYCNLNMISCMPHLPALLDTLVYDTEKIPCIPNASAAAPNAAVCNPVNDYNQCLPYPVISGIVFTDMNNNGVKDANEFPRKNIKLSLSNGAFAFTDKNGHYSLKADSIGAFTLSITVPPYYTAVPSSANFNFSRYDTAITKSFALRSAGIKDSLSIKIIPLNNAARQGFGFPYMISYENAGTTNLSPSLSLQYDNTRLNYDSSSNAAVTNTGNSLGLQIASLAPGQNDFFTAYFRIKPSAANGDLLKAKATIADAVVSIDSCSTVIRGSYDPNDKQASTQLTPAQVASGNYIDYVIRFQNTGYDTAFTVVISDAISSQLLVNSFELTEASHPCNITIANKVIFFEFKNIRLPDSNVNEMKSHGFVSFRLQPSPAVTLNSTIENLAAIYFDYNQPVITNTAFTVIKNPGQVYLFTGNGNWNDPSNWKSNVVPPSSIQQNEMVIINPADNGECILNVPVTALPGAAVSVQPGKSFVVKGNLTIQQ